MNFWMINFFATGEFLGMHVSMCVFVKSFYPKLQEHSKHPTTVAAVRRREYYVYFEYLLLARYNYMTVAIEIDDIFSSLFSLLVGRIKLAE